ncbi:hypothetical protein DXG01_005853, partial [Tephrocybe rancida]
MSLSHSHGWSSRYSRYFKYSSSGLIGAAVHAWRDGADVVYEYVPEENEGRRGGSYHVRSLFLSLSFSQSRSNRSRRSMGRERGRTMSSRNSQTGPVRVEPMHHLGSRTYLRTLTPSKYRREGEQHGHSLSPFERDKEHFEIEREREREREECEHEDREEQRKRERRNNGKCRGQNTNTSPGHLHTIPTLSASLTLRAPRPLHEHGSWTKPRQNGTSVSSNAYTAGNQYAPSGSAPKSSKLKARGPPLPAPPDAFAPPRMVLPGLSSKTARGKRSIRNEEDYGLPKTGSAGATTMFPSLLGEGGQSPAGTTAEFAGQFRA